jgi:hypothetical protein
VIPNQSAAKRCQGCRQISNYSESRLMLSLVNVIILLIWSHNKNPFTLAYYMKTTGYRYHSVNVITFGLAQSDHIKRLLLYYLLNDVLQIVIFN